EQLAERARVDEAQLTALGEAHHHVGVLGAGFAGAALGPEDLAADTQVHDEHVAALDADDQVLALAVDAGDLQTLEAAGELLAVAVTPDHPHVDDLDVFDLATDDLAVEVAPQRFDLGELRHPRPRQRRQLRRFHQLRRAGCPTPLGRRPVRLPSWFGPHRVRAARR